MMHMQYYSEVNQAVPGGTTSVSPGHEGAYGECQVPSPSQWSDPCYSPPSFHSPQHLPGDLDKVKEEPYSPPPQAFPPSPNQAYSPPPSHHHHHHHPYTRPLQITKKENYETSLNITELLAENNILSTTHSTQPHHHHNQNPSQPQYNSYVDHPLLRTCLDDNNPSKNSSGGGSNDNMGFLSILFDVKQEVEDEAVVNSNCTPNSTPTPNNSPPIPQPTSPTSNMGCQRDILETVELLALEHARKDVQRVSDSLNIPRDPAQWSVGDVRAWLEQQAAHLQLPPLMLHFWNYGGQELLKLTESQFRQLAPVGGELLYAQLEIWRSALRATPKLLPQPHHWSGRHGEHGLLVSPFMFPSPQEEQIPQVDCSTPPHMSSPNHLNSPTPPLPHTLPQVPTTAAVQVSQQQQQQQQQQHIQGISRGSCSPPVTQTNSSSSSSSVGGGVYLEEQCLDVAALLQRQGSTESTHSTRLPAHSPHDDAYDSEDDIDEDLITTTTTTNNTTTTTTTTTTGGGGRGGTHIHLWQFLKELLQQPQVYGSCIRWLDRQKGVFKIEDSVRVARLWGKRKNRPAMNYDKLSRSIRQYYKKGIMKKTERSQRLVYQFCHPYCL